MSRIYAGWHISRDFVRVVLVRKSRKRTYVVSTVEKENPGGNLNYSLSVIKEIITTHFNGRPPSRNVLTFSFSELYKESIAVPRTRKINLVKMLSHEIEERSIAFNTMVFVAQQMVGKNSLCHFQVFGINKQFLRDCAHILHETVNPPVYIAEEAFLRTVTRIKGLSRNETALLVVSDAAVTLFCMENDSIQFAESVSVKKGEDCSRDIKKLWLSFKESSSRMPERILAFGSSDQVTECAGLIQKEDAVIVQTITEDVNSIGPEYCAAYGSIAGFLQKDFRSIPVSRDSDTTEVVKKTKIPLNIVLAGTLLLFFGQSFYNVRLNRYEKAISDNIEQQTHRILGTNVPIVDPIRQIRDLVKDDRERDAIYSKRISDAPELIIIIDQSLEGITGMDIKTIDFSYSGLFIKGTSNNFEHLQQWKNKIAQIRQISRVDVENAIRNEKTGTINFNIKVEYRKHAKRNI